MSTSVTLTLLTLAIAAGGLFLRVWRRRDALSDGRARSRLVELAGLKTETFSLSRITALPEPAQRFFRYTIREGTSLHRVVEIEMEGELSLGTKEKPNYRPMRARQLNAAPFGFVWSLKWNGVGGSDGALPGTSWTRFWLFGIVPIVRASGPDHLRSSFGRMAADSLFWAPASLLPSEHVSWEALGPDSARAIVRFRGLEQAVDLFVNPNGQPERVVFERWSNENPERIHKLQPFGGDLSDFREFSGYRLPTTVVAGNHYGTEAYFPFYKAHVTAVRFP